MKFSGQIKKMISKHLTPISYDIPIGNDLIPVSTFLDKMITINFLNEINCIECEREIKKTFAQGYCYPCFINSPRTSECILKPELCRAHEGESRDIEWSKKHCLKEHFVYLSLTAGAKIGVTRATQIPTRWIDQGAVQALKFAKTSNRYEAGAIEVQMKNHISDRTAWQRMLKNEIDDSISEEVIGFGEVLPKGEYVLVNDILNKEEEELTAKAGDKVVAFDDEAPVDTVLGVEIFPVVHMKTQEKIYVSLEDIKE